MAPVRVATAVDRAFAMPTTPTQWSAAVVRERLVEAFDLERQLPGRDGPSRLRSAWCAMPAPLDSFADLVAQGEAPRSELYRRWARAAGLRPAQVARMEQVLDWPRRFLLPAHVVEARCLLLWAWARSYGRPLRRLLAARGFSRATFLRRADVGAEKIATALILIGEPVN
jgi:hypothetical protein